MQSSASHYFCPNLLNLILSPFLRLRAPLLLLLPSLEPCFMFAIIRLLIDVTTFSPQHMLSMLDFQYALFSNFDGFSPVFETNWMIGVMKLGETSGFLIL